MNNIEKINPLIDNTKENNFDEEKEKVNNFLVQEYKNEPGTGMHKNEGQLNEDVKNLVIKMNELPFLYTTQSAGKLVRKDLLDEEMSVYRPSSVHFITDEEKLSQQFIEKLKLFLKKTEGSLFDPRITKNPEKQKLPYILELGNNNQKESKKEEVETLEKKEIQLQEDLQEFIDNFIKENITDKNQDYT